MSYLQQNQRLSPLDALAKIGSIIVPSGPLPATPPPSPLVNTPSPEPQTPIFDAPPTQAPDYVDVEPSKKAKGGVRPGAGRRRKGAESNLSTPIVGNLPTLPTPGQMLHPEVTEVMEAHFPVVEARTVSESMEANAAALVTDAFRRAARAGSSGDQFDRIVYLSLLQKALPQARKEADKPMSPGVAKATLAALDRILADTEAEDAELVEPEPGG